MPDRHAVTAGNPGDDDFGAPQLSGADHVSSEAVGGQGRSREVPSGHCLSGHVPSRGKRRRDGASGGDVVRPDRPTVTGNLVAIRHPSENPGELARPAAGVLLRE